MTFDDRLIARVARGCLMVLLAGVVPAVAYYALRLDPLQTDIDEKRKTLARLSQRLEEAEAASRVDDFEEVIKRIEEDRRILRRILPHPEEVAVHTSATVERVFREAALVTPELEVLDDVEELEFYNRRSLAVELEGAELAVVDALGLLCDEFPILEPEEISIRRSGGLSEESRSHIRSKWSTFSYPWP